MKQERNHRRTGVRALVMALLLVAAGALWSSEFSSEGTLFDLILRTMR